MMAENEGVMELSHVKKSTAQAVLLIVGVVMLCFGVWRGETLTVLSKAIKLCFAHSHMSLRGSLNCALQDRPPPVSPLILRVLNAGG